MQTKPVNYTLAIILSNGSVFLLVVPLQTVKCTVPFQCRVRFPWLFPRYPVFPATSDQARTDHDRQPVRGTNYMYLRLFK